jgi:hypothetical protein
MTETPSQHGWSAEALYNKALLYVGEMERYTPDDWQHRLWASFSMEFLARAALAHVSPTLLAERNDWRNTYHALGYPPTKRGFVPRSIGTVEVLKILSEIRPEFTKEMLDSCIEQCGHRNAEIHTGEDAFAGRGTAIWLPKYFASCQVFLESMGRSLRDLFDDPKLAEDMIASLKDTAAESVKKDIAAYKASWEHKAEAEQRTLGEQAATWASRHSGHRTVCPACGRPALVRGAGQGSVSTDVRQDLVVQKQTMLPSAFECIACGLKISGLSKLTACGLGDTFTATTTLSPAEYFGLYTEEDLEEARMTAAEPEWEDDFNEY